MYKTKIVLHLVCASHFLSFNAVSIDNTNLTNVGRASQDFFANTLLIINFNFPHYSNIPFLKKLYSPIFKNIVFYGEKDDSEVITVHSREGYLLAEVIHDALTRFPDCKGYIFLQDDCVFNFWNCLHFDLTKIWYTIKYNSSDSRNDIFCAIKNFDGSWQGLAWGAWDWQWCFPAAVKSYKNLTAQEFNVLEKNIGKNNIPHQMCDMFYIPHRFKESVLRLNSVFKDVFSEIGMTTLFCCLDLIENWEHLKMFAGARIHQRDMERYSVNFHWVHPVKFSYQANRDMVSKVFNEILIF